MRYLSPPDATVNNVELKELYEQSKQACIGLVDNDDLPGFDKTVAKVMRASETTDRANLWLMASLGWMLFTLKERNRDKIGLRGDARDAPYIDFLQRHNIHKKKAQRACRLITVENWPEFPSVHLALESIRKPKPPGQQSAAQTTMEGQALYIEQLEKDIEELKRPPGDDELEARIDRLEREKRGMLSRLSEMRIARDTALQEIDRVVLERDTARNELETARAEVADLQERLDEIEGKLEYDAGLVF